MMFNLLIICLFALLNREQIINYLTKATYIKSACLIAGDLKDDLFQHIWVKILELKNIEDIYKKGYLDFYIMRMIKNEATNPNNPFLKMIAIKTSGENVNYWDQDFNVNVKYKEENKFIEPEQYDHESDTQFETTLSNVKEKLKSLYWYDKAIFELYLIHKSLRKVAAETGIKYGAIHQTINKVKKQLNESVANRN